MPRKGVARAAIPGRLRWRGKTTGTPVFKEGWAHSPPETTMKLRISNPTDFWAGIMLIALGAMFAGKAFTYKLGTTAQMGAGFFPFWLRILLILLKA